MSAEVYRHTSWIPHRTAPVSTKGMVAAKMPQAAEAGTSVLAKGGSAIDAAVATAFAIGVVEPAMNGIGGGGFMVVWLAEQQRSVVIDFPMIAPQGAHADMYELQQASTPSLFGWPGTVESRHVQGPHSIAVPGTVAGLSLALSEFGTMSLAEVMQPAIELAESGFPVTNYITTMIAKDVAVIRQYPETAKTFLNANGDPLFSLEQANPTMIRQPELANSLRLIAERGPDAFYRGEIGEKIARYLGEEGTVFTADDLASYEARVVEPMSVEYHGHTVYTSPGGTGGTSLAQALQALNLMETPSPQSRSAEQWHGTASVFRQAFADRFTYLADPDCEDVPIQALTSTDYAAETVAAIGDRATSPRAGTRERLGVSHQLDASVPEFMKDGSTTHLGVIDAEGNAVSLTQTLLALFGSRVTIPGTGILMNNGMMWFDPEPGRPNSVAGGKRPLSNMAPAVVVHNNQARAVVGASGGRKIMNCNAQVVMNIIDSDMTAQEAISAPRIDCSTRDLLISNRVDPEVIEGLRELGYAIELRHEGLLTGDFSSPVAIRRSADGTLDGGADPWYFAATAVGVE